MVPPIFQRKSETLSCSSAAQLARDVVGQLAAKGCDISSARWWQSDVGIVRSLAGHGLGAADSPQQDCSDLEEHLRERCAMHSLTFSWHLFPKSGQVTADTYYRLAVQREPRVGASEDRFRVVLMCSDAIRSLDRSGLLATVTPWDDAWEPEDVIATARAAADRLRALRQGSTVRPDRHRGGIRLLRLLPELPQTSAELFEVLAAIGWLGLDGWLRRDVGLVVVAPLLTNVPLDARWEEDRVAAERAVSTQDEDRVALLNWLFHHDREQVVVILGPFDLGLLHWAAQSFWNERDPADFPEAALGASRCEARPPVQPWLVTLLRERVLQRRVDFACSITLPQGQPTLVTWGGLSSAQVQDLETDSEAGVVEVSAAINEAVRVSLGTALASWRASPLEATEWQAPSYMAMAHGEPAWVQAGEFPPFPQIVAPGWNLSIPAKAPSSDTEDSDAGPSEADEHEAGDADDAGHEPDTTYSAMGVPRAIAVDAACSRLVGFYRSIGMDSSDQSGWSTSDNSMLDPNLPAPSLQLLQLPRGTATSRGEAGHVALIALPTTVAIPDQVAELDARMVAVETELRASSPGRQTLLREARDWRLEIDVKAIGFDAPGIVTDTGAFLRSATSSGPQFLWTCECGTPQCDGIYWPVMVRHTRTQVQWAIERPVWAGRSSLRTCELIAFPREHYLEVARRVLAQVRELLARTPATEIQQWAEMRARAVGPFGWFGFSEQVASAFVVP